MMARSSYLARSTLALILAGGRGSRLLQLTEHCVKPALPFGGKFRVIDFPLSNCLNSGIRRIGVLTQYESTPLIHHLQRGWSFLHAELNEFIDLLPAQQRTGGDCWYRGTADAIAQNLDFVRRHAPRNVLVLAGDHVYKMDYARLLEDHERSRADCTVACITVPRQDAHAFGVMHTDNNWRITAFSEKPENPPGMANAPDKSLVSMGIYVFSTDYLVNTLNERLLDPETQFDFGRDILPHAVRHDRCQAHLFDESCIKDTPLATSYWRDIGTLDSYWAANMDLVSPLPALNLYDNSWPISTSPEQMPPCKFVFNDDDRRGMAVDSMVGDGSIISGAHVEHSLLFSRCRLHSHAEVRHSILLPGVDVGQGARLDGVVVDSGTRIPPGLVVGGEDGDSNHFQRSRGGITLVTQAMVDTLTNTGRHSLSWHRP